MKLIEKGFLERNKKVIVISILIMFLSIVAGGVIAYSMTGNTGLISEMIRNSSNVSTSGGITLNGFNIIMHNFTVAVLIILGGLILSIPSLLLIVFNGIDLGTIFGVDLTFACTSVLPHGIIEYLSLALALAIALKIARIEVNIIKNRSFNIFEEYNVELKDILVLFIIIVILLIIAGIIEAYITPLVVTNYYGI
ncbi:MAG: hypothetical protein BZ137_01605 [Methanosphaera sp. rholeuAM130]|nr:MAG: hypothetical protein BZ137_01605 [Methanosphaera sp. rholeuAM130]